MSEDDLAAIVANKRADQRIAAANKLADEARAEAEAERAEADLLRGLLAEAEAELASIKGRPYG